MSQDIQVTPLDGSRETPSRLMMPVFMGEGLFHGLRQLFAGRLLLLMIEKNIRSLMLAPAVDVEEDGPFIGLFILFCEGIDHVHPLF